MSDQKISAMQSASALDGTVLVPMVQGGANVKATLATLRAFNAAYGGFSDATDQVGDVASGTEITFDTVDVADGVTLASGSQITVPNDGIYSFQFSIQFKNTDNAQHDATIWLRINGSDLVNSATRYTIPARKSASILGYSVASLSFLLDLDATDYVEIVWLPSDAAVTVEHLPASLSPAYPAIPSAIVSVLQVA